MKVASLYVALGLAAVAQAQICATNLLIDDFRTGQRPTTGPAGNDRIYDLAGGDYGGVGLQGNIAIADGSGTITPDNSAAGLNGTNYFFVKYDPNACFDATKYTGLQMEFTFPANADFQIAYTQKAPNCVDRLDDSEYKKLSDFIVPNGGRQTVFLPFSVFGHNVRGGLFDWKHIKDLTFLQFVPTRVPYTFHNLTLIANTTACANQPVVNQSSTTTAAAPASTAGITSNVASGAVSMPLVAVVKTALLSALVATMASML
ncbi:hypothetical protein SeLEV6574_g04250 [Synchytrium endobioticum]|uniref:NADH:ubiquinone oxidoreductase intermediate-associated protein 30 domain-containing protein n=1 Tax=Synchytrium endobioticum TaxID=286115 RepID=A0A507D084_9FUNG|nr:hypothetical protein SeLEV6574_g04250 [Synchytrium endobioticum]